MRAAQRALESQLLTALARAEAEATAAFAAGDAARGAALLSEHAVATGATASAAWRELWQARETRASKSVHSLAAPRCLYQVARVAPQAHRRPVC